MGGFFSLTLNSAIEFVKHQAWLDATPKADKISRREYYKDSYLTRAQPETYCVWLVQFSIECGQISQASMGITSLSWQELKAWQDVTCNYNIWTAQAIKELSLCYVSEYKASVDPTRPSALQAYVDQLEQRKRVSNQLKQMFR